MEFLLIGCVLAIVSMFVGGWIAGQKNRSSSEGMKLGFWLGPFGVLIELLLPTIEPPKKKPRSRMSRTGWQAPEDDGFDAEAANWLRNDPAQ